MLRHTCCSQPPYRTQDPRESNKDTSPCPRFSQYLPVHLQSSFHELRLVLPCSFFLSLPLIIFYYADVTPIQTAAQPVADPQKIPAPCAHEIVFCPKDISPIAPHTPDTGEHFPLPPDFCLRDLAYIPSKTPDVNRDLRP